MGEVDKKQEDGRFKHHVDNDIQNTFFSAEVFQETDSKNGIPCERYLLGNMLVKGEGEVGKAGVGWGSCQTPKQI